MTGPKALRLAVALAAAVLAAVLAASAFAARPQRSAHLAVGLDPLELGVLADINAFRRGHGLVALRLSPQLTEAARQHSHEMAADGYFAHSSVSGGAFWKRIERFYPGTAFGYWSVGENLLWSSPGVSSTHALQMWEASPEHRANLMTARWREIGISAVHVGSAPGAYHGLPVTIVTTDFGVRR